MKSNKLLRKALPLSAILSLSLLLAACVKSGQQVQTVPAPESPVGIYTNIQDFEDVRSRLVGTHAMKGERETVGQVASLTVYNTPVAIELDESNNARKDANGEIIHVANDDETNKFYKYVFAKDSIVAGEAFLVYSRGQYTGYCTYDSATGGLTMYTPEYFMTYSTNKSELDNWEGTVTNTKVTDEILAQPSSGLNFASDWQDFFGYTRPDPLQVTLTQDLTFQFVSQYQSDDSGLGNQYDYEFQDYGYLYEKDENNGGGN